MAVSKAQQKAVNKYVKEKYDRILLTMPKGRKEQIQTAAEARGESVNGFINRLISDALDAESGVQGQSSAQDSP